MPTNGLIGYWTGNGTAADSSAVGNHGSFNGSYATGAPKGGQAFDLGTGKVVIADHAAYDFTSYAGWSVGFWFNTNNTSLFNAVFLGQDNGSGYNPKWFIDWGYTVFGYNDYFNFHVNDYNRERIFVGSSSQPESSLTGWNQLTVTIDNVNSGRVNFYLNGFAIGSATMGPYVLQPTAPLILGYAEGFTYQGLMSDVVIYNRVLLQDEVMGLATVPDGSSTAVLCLVGLGALGMARGRTARRTPVRPDRL